MESWRRRGRCDERSVGADVRVRRHVTNEELSGRGPGRRRKTPTGLLIIPKTKSEITARQNNVTRQKYTD